MTPLPTFADCVSKDRIPFVQTLLRNWVLDTWTSLVVQFVFIHHVFLMQRKHWLMLDPTSLSPLLLLDFQQVRSLVLTRWFKLKYDSWRFFVVSCCSQPSIEFSLAFKLFFSHPYSNCSGQTPLSYRLMEIKDAVAKGATEIDIVLSRSHVMQGNWEEVSSPPSFCIFFQLFYSLVQPWAICCGTKPLSRSCS